MKQKINKFWFLLLIIPIICVFLFFLLYLIFYNKSVEYSDLCIKILGFITSFGAMIFLAVTFIEQKKMNKEQIKINRSIDNKQAIDIFKLQSDPLLILYKDKQSEIDKYWGDNSDSDSIEYYLQNITFPNIREKTNKNRNALCDKAENFSEMIQLAKNLNQLLDIKKQTFSDQILYLWDCIPERLKIHVGFFLAWNNQLFNIKEKNENELIFQFLKKYPDKLPELIPDIVISATEDRLPFSEDNLGKLKFFIQSRSQESIF